MPVHAIAVADLESKLPPAAETRLRLRNYMDVAGISVVQLSGLMNYGVSTLRAFLNDKYSAYRVAKSDVYIRKSAEDFMARFPLGPQSSCRASGRLYETENVLQIRRWVDQCLEHAYMFIGYGPPGSQKTYVAEHIVAEHNRREASREDQRDFVYLVRSSYKIGPRDLLARICKAVGVPQGMTKEQCFASLSLAVRHRRVVLIIDEAQLLGLDSFETMRELYDAEHVGILFLGSHELNTFFQTHAAKLEQFNSRIEDREELVGVSERSARTILSLELPELSAELINAAISSAFVSDPYSRAADQTYCSMRRLFKTIESFKQQQDEQSDTNALPEVIQ